MNNYDEHEVCENHEKDRERRERLTQSTKARSRRALVKGKQARQHESGYGGNV